MLLIQWIIKALSWLSKGLSWLYKYRDIYKITGIFATRKFPAARKPHKYAVLIAARNEAAVIGKLLESIRMQDYPSELITVFVVADNCTDETAALAREGGAICYERTDLEHRTKGYALQFLVECIRRDYGIEAFEGYFLFDADNLLKSDFISRMNDSFDAGEKIITSYRNTKNIDDNWISASYALHWLRTIRNEHRPRSLFRLATRIQGTGFLFANELIADGWNYTSLTEDRAFCADAVVKGYRISYNHDAIFYDEQPVNIKIAMRQRIRWSKGHLQAFAESGGKLFINIFKKHSFMSYDMLTTIFPNSLVSILRKWIVYLLRLVLIVLSGKTFGAAVTLTAATLWWTARSWFNNMLSAAYLFLIEHRRIQKIAWYKKLWYCLTFPMFDLIGKFSLVIALFCKVEWKPIPHTAAVGIEQMSDPKAEDAAAPAPAKVQP